jgi:mRNA-degrading endonuclease RelE of RelBE toxin-antitoxin system
MWQVTLTRKAAKQLSKLPLEVQNAFDRLAKELEVEGPMQPNWKNFSKLSSSTYHCHIKKGRPTYVVCWEVRTKEIRLVEVYYVGTHEGAPY